MYVFVITTTALRGLISNLTTAHHQNNTTTMKPGMKHTNDNNNLNLPLNSVSFILSLHIYTVFIDVYTFSMSKKTKRAVKFLLTVY